MGEDQCTLFAPEFNRSIRVEQREERLTGDAGGSARLRLVAHALDAREGDVAAEVQEAYFYAKVAEDVERPSRT